MTQPPQSIPSVRPAWDRELGELLPIVNQQIPPTITVEMLQMLGAAAGAQAALLESSVEELKQTFEVTERTIATADDTGVMSLLIMRPQGVRSPLPGMIFLHGGGMISGDNRSGITVAGEWAQAVPMVVISVDYRLAPEHPHPAPVEDCYAGLVWVADNATELGVDPDRLLISGISAGGGLSAGVTLMARDRGGPRLKGQMLMCPMLDDRGITSSSGVLDGEGVWDRTSNATGWWALLGDLVGGPEVPAYAAPARATDLAGLPPAFIDVGSAEVFRDEDVDYAIRIWQAGGDVELHVWPGGFHGFADLVPEAMLSRAARAARITWLRRLFSAEA